MREVIIIGGGPAGSSAAIHLTNAGLSPYLVERKHGMHDKVCGEFINNEAANLLTELGLDLPALGAQPITQLALHCGSKRLVSELSMPGWSFSRRELDAHLLAKARRAGAIIETGVTVKELNSTQGGWSLICSKYSSENHQREMQSINAKAVFLATGKHDLHNWQRRVKNAANYELIGLKMHLELTASQQEQLTHSVEMYFYDGGYAGLEPIENNKANLCFLIRRDVYKQCGGSWDCIAEWLGKTSPHLKNRLLGAHGLWPKPLAISAVPYGYTHSPLQAVPNLFRIGDQAAVIHSLAGDGISIALHSGRLAAQIYANKGDSQSFYSRTQKLFSRPIANAQIVADILSNSIGRRAAFLASRYWPGILPAAIARVRILASQH